MMFEALNITDVLYWHWGLLAIGLFIIEMIAPVLIFLWIGIAAAIVALLSFMMPKIGMVPLSFNAELTLFAVLSIVSVLVWRVYQRKNPVKEIMPTLNQRGAQYIAHELTVTADFVDGRGREKVGASYWGLVCRSGEAIKSGSKVRVVAAESAILVVEPV